VHGVVDDTRGARGDVRMLAHYVGYQSQRPMAALANSQRLPSGRLYNKESHRRCSVGKTGSTY
jgi:hypothetical protein